MYINDSRDIEHAFIKSIRFDDEVSWIGLSIASLRPRFGGQLEDKGAILNKDRWVPIVGVKFALYGLDIAIPSVDCHFSVDDLILIKKDFEYNLNISRTHSALHLLCALSAYEMRNAYAGDKLGRVDFSGDSDQFNRDLPLVKERFRKIVTEAIDVYEIYATKEEVNELGNVKEFGKIDLNLYRIISINGIDNRICMGSHVSNTREIGEVSISPAIKLGDTSFKVNVCIF